MPDGATAAYEVLRLQVIQPGGRIEYADGRCVLMRCGLARWAQVQSPATTVESLSSHPRHRSCPTEMPTAVEPELVKLVACLILSRRQELVHA